MSGGREDGRNEMEMVGRWRVIVSMGMNREGNRGGKKQREMEDEGV